MSKIISACGLDCYSCECYRATRSGDLQQKENIAEKWSKEYEAVLTADDINCDGCMATGVHFNWCNRCPIRACVIEKQYQNCSFCAEFPCEKGAFIYDNVPEAKQNIESLR